MTTEKNKAIVRRLYEEAWGQGKLSVLDEVYPAVRTVHWHELKPADKVSTVEELKQTVKAYRQAFPDLQITIDSLVAEGDQVVAQVTFQGTHSQSFAGYAPTHRHSSFTDMQIHRLANGKIIEHSLASGGLRCFHALLDGSLFKEQGL